MLLCCVDVFCFYLSCFVRVVLLCCFVFVWICVRFLCFVSLFAVLLCCRVARFCLFVLFVFFVGLYCFLCFVLRVRPCVVVRVCWLGVVVVFVVYHVVCVFVCFVVDLFCLLCCFGGGVNACRWDHVG